MFVVNSFEHMESKTRQRKMQLGMDIPYTVGILICDYERQFCKENIINQLSRLDRQTGDLIDFYVPGYCSRINDGYRAHRERYNHFHDDYAFSRGVFDDFIEQLESKGIRTNGHAQIVLLSCNLGNIAYRDYAIMDLERLFDNVRMTPREFFDFLVEISREENQLQGFKAAIRKREAYILIRDFISTSFRNRL